MLIDFDELQKIGLGWMGIPEEEFWEMSPKAYFLKHEGFLELEQVRSRDAWERHRLFTTELINMSMKSVKRRIRPDQVVRFNWEKKQIVRPDKEITRYWVQKLGGKSS